MAKEDIKENYLDLTVDPDNTGSVRRIEEGFHELDSKWILGFNANRYRYGTWIMTVHFDPNTTDSPANPGGKKSVTIYGIETRTILAFEKAVSPGDFYINNFALLPNASGNGGGSFKYATSEFNDLAKTFIRDGLDGITEFAKDKIIPDSIRNHLKKANKYQNLATNPETFIKNYVSRSKRFVEKELGLAPFFKTTKQLFSIGVDITEAVYAPEVYLTKSIRNLTKKQTNKLTKKARNKFANKLL